jgi:hypothetical protein
MKMNKDILAPIADLLLSIPVMFLFTVPMIVTILDIT